MAASRNQGHEFQVIFFEGFQDIHVLDKPLLENV